MTPGPAIDTAPVEDLAPQDVDGRYEAEAAFTGFASELDESLRTEGSELVSKAFVFTVLAEDAAGNAGRASLFVKVDTEAPEVYPSAWAPGGVSEVLASMDAVKVELGGELKRRSPGSGRWRGGKSWGLWYKWPPVSESGMKHVSVEDWAGNSATRSLSCDVIELSGGGWERHTYARWDPGDPVAVESSVETVQWAFARDGQLVRAEGSDFGESDGHTWRTTWVIAFLDVSGVSVDGVSATSGAGIVGGKPLGTDQQVVISGSFPGLREEYECSLAAGGPPADEWWGGLVLYLPDLTDTSYTDQAINGTHTFRGWPPAGAWPVAVDYGAGAIAYREGGTPGAKEVWTDSMRMDAYIEEPHMLYRLDCATKELCAGTRASLRIRGGGFGEEGELALDAVKFSKEGLSDDEVANCIRLARDGQGNAIPPRIERDDPFNGTAVQSLVAEIETAPETGFDGIPGTADDPPGGMLGDWDVLIKAGEIQGAESWYLYKYAFGLVGTAVRIALTFDDGPDGREDHPIDSGKNLTQLVLQNLKDYTPKPCIKAAFFVRTHELNSGGSEIGEELIRREGSGFHVLGIHTGGEGRHRLGYYHINRVEEDPYVLDGETVPDAQNALDCDLYFAKKRIRELTGAYPEYVRPPRWYLNEAVASSYKRQNLKVIFTDIFSADSGWDTPLQSVGLIAWYCRSRTRNKLRAGMTELVANFHDWNDQTAVNLHRYLDAILEGAEDAGYRSVYVQFCYLPGQVKSILNQRYEEDWKDLVEW